jgi:fatty-acyl-CoA synthase
VVLFTSGTSGVPKGALLTQANHAWNAMGHMAGLPWVPNAPTRVMQAMPFHHSGGLHAVTSAATYLGNSMVIVRDYDAERALDIIARERINTFFLMQSILEEIMKVPKDGRYDLSAMYGIVTGAGDTNPDFVHRLMDYFEIDRVCGGYGLTEAAPLVATTATTAELLRGPSSVGKPAFFIDVEVRDGEGRLRPVNEPGELWIKGPNIFKGYHGMPEATADVLVDGWFRTGDVLQLDDDGYLTFIGRAGDMIKTGGENVYPAEVEPKLLSNNPELDEIVIVGVPSMRWGEAIVAVAVPKPGQHIDERVLIDRCRPTMAGFKLPKCVVFVDGLPKTALGAKIQRAEVRRMALDALGPDAV